MAQMVKSLPSKFKAQRSNPALPKRGKKEQQFQINKTD
jgi:hypothetical protein